MLTPLSLASSSQSHCYCGRFAPSPTGSLHFGSLLAAVGSYLHARHQRGRWLVRIEDVDLPRTIANADKWILQTLTQFGMVWDGEVRYQSQQNQSYQDALDTLQQQNLIFPCSCSRKRLAGQIYDGHCRQGMEKNGKNIDKPAIRLKVAAQTQSFNDVVYGRVQQNLATEVGDFIIRRRGGLFAYQLAVVVDDAEQGITDVVRGVDLLDSTPRQIYLQQLLHYPTPRYCHLPVVVDEHGHKLSKQQGAPAIAPNAQPVPLLYRCLVLLGQQPPSALQDSDLTTFWDWAIAHWSTARIPTTTELSTP